jgi:hypothetical protein
VARAHLLTALDSRPAPWYRRWWRPLPVAAVAALAIAAVIGFRQLAPTPPAVNIARFAPPAPPAPATAPAPAQPAPSEPAAPAPARSDRLTPPAAVPAAPPAMAPPGGGGGGSRGPAPSPVRLDALAQIDGSVNDPAGSAVPGAKVTAREVGSGTVHTATTNLDGQFNLQAVPPGKYELQIASAGFQSAFREVSVEERDRAVLKTTLNVAAAAETVEAKADALKVDTLKTEDLKKDVQDGRGGRGAQKALAFAAGSAMFGAPALQYSVLFLASDGSFIDTGVQARVAAGTPIKLRIVPNETGSLLIRESQPDGGWRDLTTQHVERGKAFDTQPLTYSTPGRRQFQVFLSPDVDSVNGAVPPHQVQAPAVQQRSRPDVTIMVTIR